MSKSKAKPLAEKTTTNRNKKPIKQDCYKSGKECIYNCSGLCKESC